MSSKKPSDHYIALGVTAFCVIGASILFFFLLYHFTGVWALVEKLMLILRPILYGLVLAFLLLPVRSEEHTSEHPSQLRIWGWGVGGG